MKVGKFKASDWIGQLAGALPKLAEAQAPYLQENVERYSRAHDTFRGVYVTESELPLADLRTLYDRARQNHVSVEAEYFEPLCAKLDPVRHILLRHPTLSRVVGPIIGRDNFYMRILNSGGLTSLTNLIAGLMARASELPGDRFWTAAGELNSLLTSAGQAGSDELLDGLDIGYDAVLFFGLTVKKRTEVADGLSLLPFKQVQAFIDESLVEELAPPGTGYHNWQSIGAAVRTFQWKPAFYRSGFERDAVMVNPHPFFREVQTFLDLLAVAHATPVLRLANVAHCIKRSAGHLLGQDRHNDACYRGRSAQAFDGFEASPELESEAFDQAKTAFQIRTDKRYSEMAMVVGRLSEALARNSRFSGADRILDVAIALERMYMLDHRRISRNLQDRAAWYLTTNEESREKIRESVKEFYGARSDIIHNRMERVTAQRNQKAFHTGFDIARRSLFKLLREGPPENWDAAAVEGQ